MKNAKGTMKQIVSLWAISRSRIGLRIYQNNAAPTPQHCWSVFSERIWSKKWKCFTFIDKLSWLIPSLNLDKNKHNTFKYKWTQLISGTGSDVTEIHLFKSGTRPDARFQDRISSSLISGTQITYPVSGLFCRGKKNKNYLFLAPYGFRSRF
jgi:hypothetical protein